MSGITMTKCRRQRVGRPFAADLTLCPAKLQAARRQSRAAHSRKAHGKRFGGREGRKGCDYCGRHRAAPANICPRKFSTPFGGRGEREEGGRDRGVISGDFNEVTRGATNDTIYRITGNGGSRWAGSTCSCHPRRHLLSH